MFTSVLYCCQCDLSNNPYDYNNLTLEGRGSLRGCHDSRPGVPRDNYIIFGILCGLENYVI